jgi:predicted nucleic acid-binding Zn ribbon protein
MANEQEDAMVNALRRHDRARSRRAIILFAVVFAVVLVVFLAVR